MKANDKSEHGYGLFLYLLMLHFFNCLIFDFSSSLYGFFIPTPLSLPSFAPLSITIWLFITSVIFLKILKILGYNRMTVWILLIYFLLLYGTGINVVGNSVQLKLWILGYKDSLGLGLSYPTNLASVPSSILPVFKLLYFYDEYLGHLLMFTGYFMFFLIFYFADFKYKKFEPLEKHIFLFYSSVILNGIYVAWLVIEGQSIAIYLVVTAMMVAVKIYQRSIHHYADVFGRQIELIFLAAWVYIFLWFAIVGHFKTLPQFFETEVVMLGIKI